MALKFNIKVSFIVDNPACMWQKLSSFNLQKPSAIIQTLLIIEMLGRKYD